MRPLVGLTRLTADATLTGSFTRQSVAVDRGSTLGILISRPA